MKHEIRYGIIPLNIPVYAHGQMITTITDELQIPNNQ